MALKKSSKKSLYFIGIGGIGMSALARYFKAQNWAVSGSDLVHGRMTKELRKEGIRVKIGHKKANITRDISLIIYNRAIPKDSPELLAAKVLGIPTLPYAHALGAITKNYRTIAITGSHGKSTTTALAGLILARAGLDPTVFVGTELKEFKGNNIRIGKGPYMVLEADDFGKAFLNYYQSISVITNIDREHFDTYRTLAIAKNAFLEFLARTKDGGVFILNKDDKNLFSLKSRIAKIAKKKNVYALWHSNHGNTAKKVGRVIRIPGAHNLSNAVAAYKVGRMLGVPHKKILNAISKYHGAWRRMEYRGTFRGAKVYDDYAHHPTEIKASLQGFKEKYPGKKILCVFQPHQARRLEALFKEFQSAFDLADETLIMPIYQVAGRDPSLSFPRKRESRFSSAALVGAIQKKQPEKPLFYLESPKNLKKAVITLLSPASKNLGPRFRGDDTIIVMMGAGDIVQYTDGLLN